MIKHLFSERKNRLNDQTLCWELRHIMLQMSPLIEGVDGSTRGDYLRLAASA
jgi:hypothetical protein